MYQSGYPYQQMYQPYYQQLQQLQNQIPNIQQQMSHGQPQLMSQNGGMFYFVNSQKEAENWVLEAGQTAFFFERNMPVFYIKSVAQNGLSQPIEVYDYSQRKSSAEPQKEAVEVDMTQYITRQEFDALKAELDEIRGTEG